MAAARKPRKKAGAPSAEDIIGRRDTRRGRFYDIANGEAYPSVTTVLHVVNKPALIGWAAKEERKLVLHSAAEIYAELGEALAVPLTKGEFKTRVEEHMGTAKAHHKMLREAADIGTQVHKAIEYDIDSQLVEKGLYPAEKLGTQPEMTHPKARESWKKYLAWKASVRMEPLASERQIVSHVHKFAGTEDILLRIWPLYDDPIWKVVIRPEDFEANGLVVTGDFKTGKAVYAEMFLQNGAYRLAEIEMGLSPASQAGIIIRLPKEADDPGFEVVPVPPLEQTVPVFLALRHGVFPWVKAEEQEYERKRQERKAREERENAA